MEQHGLSTPSFTLKGLNCHCRIVDMYDADTFTLIVPLFDKFFKFSCRIRGIDTAEIKSTFSALAHKAKNRMLQLCNVDGIELERIYTRKEIQYMLDKSVYLLWCVFEDFDKYGRPLVHIYDKENGTELASLLVSENLANSYFGGTKTKF